MGTLLHSCAKLHESIEISFVMVSRVGRGMAVLDGVHIPHDEGGSLGFFRPHWFEWRFECIFKAEIYSTCA